MLLRRRTRMVAILVASLVMADHAMAVAQEVLPSPDDSIARKAKKRDTDTNTYECVGACSGSQGCC
jgi:hypothetical protein